MTLAAGRKTGLFRPALAAAACLALAGCRSDGAAAPEPVPGAGDRPRAESPSRAADPLIEQAKTPEERRALEKARDEVDAEMREKARALDAEIERLRKENARLKAAGSEGDARPKPP